MTPITLQEYAIDGNLTGYTVDELAVMLGACHMLSDRIKAEVVRRG